jgi:SAM-dependent methyltransferase
MINAAGGSNRERVAAYFDRLAPVYGDGAFFAARRAAVLAEIAGDLARVRRVLDLGCGNGASGSEFVTRAPAAVVVGVDLSPRMLAVARRRLGSRVHLLEADACALPFRPGSFDLVFMSHVLLLVPDIERCIAEVSHCLAAGGTLAATVGAGGWRSALGGFLPCKPILRLAARATACRLRAANDEDRAGAACYAAGLQPELRRAPFSADWPALEEWIRLRWLTALDEPLRTLLRLCVAAMRRRGAGRTLRLAETVLIATKQ